MTKLTYSLFVLLCLACGSPEAPLQLPNERALSSVDHVSIAYARKLTSATGDSAWDIYVMAADGSNQNRLTDGLWPCWNASGTKIAFISTRDGAGDVYTMNPDGSGVQRISSVMRQMQDLSWSPDGSKFVIGMRRGAQWKIYVIDASTGDTTYMPGYRKGKTDFAEAFPAWSSDGKYIAFTVTIQYNQIFRMTAAGDSVTPLTDTPHHGNTAPAWNPAGDTLAFSASTNSRDNIFVMSSTGGPRTALTQTGGIEPTWSPDGKRIAYASDRSGNWEIWKLTRAGGGRVRLTSDLDEEAMPAWRP